MDFRHYTYSVDQENFFEMQSELPNNIRINADPSAPRVPGIVMPRQSGNSNPIVVERVEPGYTSEAHRLKISGTVRLAFTVDELGLARDIHVVSGLGHGLDENAVDALKRWRFQPALKNGVPVVTQNQVIFTFRVM